ncbi:MAG: carboxylating nicotinate-nucleotide diphosphorylase [Proteobacteria bacterium]|jgi:nicotinate-nucleotide pyrophosphorylase (carboxylating)|nr:carboxylating nicotinate-nucleotide diphosphorylase [Pseudomonadota bacterium]
MSIDFRAGLTETVARAISEDVGAGDITAGLIDAAQTSSATVITREDMVVCGQWWVDEVFAQIDAGVKPDWHVSDGDRVPADTVLFSVEGHSRSLLTAERCALNFLQTLSATATATHRMAGLISHTQTRLLDTRKTLPGLRLAQKYAVRTGGGENHRIGLFDAFLIKENHIAACGSIAAAIQRARSLVPDARLEVEVENLEQLGQALDAGPDWIMLDNFSIEDTVTAVRTARERNNPVRLEASGGIENDEDLIRIATTGVDFISIGALTKHCRAIDLSMRLTTRS